MGMIKEPAPAEAKGIPAGYVVYMLSIYTGIPADDEFMKSRTWLAAREWAVRNDLAARRGEHAECDVTEKGRVYVAKLLTTPMPVATWR